MKMQFATLCSLLFVGCFGASSAWSLDLPKPKPKKEKESKKEEPKKSDGGGNESAKKSDGGGNETAKKNDGAGDASAEVIKMVEPMVDKALAAYNAEDAKAFFADYIKAMSALGNPTMFSSLYSKQRNAYGNYVSKTLAKDRTSANAKEAGLIVYDAKFAKGGMKLDVNYMLEDGAMKLTQIQFTPADGGAALANALQEVKVPKSIWDKVEGAFKAGDWVEYEYPSAVGMKMRQDVLEVGDHMTVTLSKSTMQGQTTEQKMKTIYSEPDFKVEEQKEEKHKWETKEFSDKVSVPGHGELAATRYEMYLDGKLQSKSWVSKKVPCGGMVKAEDADGKVTMQLIGFGTK